MTTQTEHTFRSRVTEIYKNRCIICGTTARPINIIDGAQLDYTSFSRFYHGNGIMLCSDHITAFNNKNIIFNTWNIIDYLYSSDDYADSKVYGRANSTDELTDLGINVKIYRESYVYLLWKKLDAIDKLEATALLAKIKIICKVRDEFVYEKDNSAIML